MADPSPDLLFEVDLMVREQAQSQAAVWSESDPVTRIAEMMGYWAYESQKAPGPPDPEQPGRPVPFASGIYLFQGTKGPLDGGPCLVHCENMPSRPSAPSTNGHIFYKTPLKPPFNGHLCKIQDLVCIELLKQHSIDLYWKESKLDNPVYALDHPMEQILARYLLEALRPQGIQADVHVPQASSEKGGGIFSKEYAIGGDTDLCYARDPVQIL